MSGMVNLAGSEKCYGNKSCIKVTDDVLFGSVISEKAEALIFSYLSILVG